MRWRPFLCAGLVAFLAFLVALPAPAAAAGAAAPPPLVFEDAAGDVQRGEDTYKGKHADAVDVLAASMAEAGPDLRFRLALADLSAYGLLPEQQDFVTQYALTFEREDGGAFSLRADYAGLVYGTNPLGRWRFQLHDQRADAWEHADGRVDGAALEWTVPAARFGLAAGDVLQAWSVAVWWSDASGSEQINDWAQATPVYRLGAGVVVPGPEGPLAAACSLEEAWVAFVDPAADVSSRGESYEGPGAASADVLHACVAEDGEDLLFELALADLDRIAEEVEEAGFHAQYALSFRTRDDHAGHAMRALFAGKDHTGDAGGAWRFQRHDQQRDAWPEADGARQGDALVWRVPRSDLDLAAGDRLTQWSVQTWNSYDAREQHGDWAEGSGAYVVGAQRQGTRVDAAPAAAHPASGTGAGAPGRGGPPFFAPAADDGDAGHVEESPSPGASLALLALVGAAALPWRRRRA